MLLGVLGAQGGNLELFRLESCFEHTRACAWPSSQVLLHQFSCALRECQCPLQTGAEPATCWGTASLHSSTVPVSIWLYHVTQGRGVWAQQVSLDRGLGLPRVRKMWVLLLFSHREGWPWS